MNQDMNFFNGHLNVKCLSTLTTNEMVRGLAIKNVLNVIECESFLKGEISILILRSKEVLYYKSFILIYVAQCTKHLLADTTLRFY